MAAPTTTPPTSPAAPAAAPLRTGARLLLPLAGVLLVLLLVVATLAATARWLLVTPQGSAWLLGRLPAVQVQGFEGALLGPQWRARQLRVQWAGGTQWLLIEDLAADGLRWQWRPNGSAWLGIDAASVTARKVTLNTGPPGPPGKRPIVLPERIAPPLQLTLAHVRVDEVQIDALQPLRGVTLQGLALNPQPAAQHRIDSLAFDGFGVSVAGRLALGNTAPLPLAAELTARPTADADSPRWAAVLRAGGTVADLALNGTLRGLPLPGRGAPALDLRATLHPLQAWVLGALSLQTHELDLAALTPKAPSTRLSGRAELTGGAPAKDAGGASAEGARGAPGTPLTVVVQLANAIPGRFNELRLPLQQLTLELHGQLAQRNRVELTRFELLLADGSRPAGQWRGNAVWQGHELTLDTQISKLMPQRLDSRAAALTVSGPLRATLRGLPSPDFSAKDAPPPLHADWTLDLQGAFDAAPQPVRVRLDGSADAQRLELKNVRAEAGPAVIQLQASLARAAGGPAGAGGPGGDWQLQTAGSVSNFDPLPWWPGDKAMVWRKGAHRLAGDWQIDLRLPADAASLPAAALAQRVAGNGTLRIHDSVLAGVPVSADIKLGYTQAAAPTSGSLQAVLQLGGNQLSIDGRGDPLAGGSKGSAPAGQQAGAGDRWRAELKADNLTALAPLTRLYPGLTEWVPRQGTASATLTAAGRWPNVQTEGTARITLLQMGQLNLARASATWRLDTRGEQTLNLQAELAGLQWGEQRADHIRVDLRGTLANHHIDIAGALPLLAPPMMEQVLGIQAQSGTQAQLQAQGGWTADAGGGTWKAHVERLVLGSWDGNIGDAPPASGWAEARDLHAELQLDRSYKLLAARADPGTLRLANTVAMRWDEVRVDLRGAQPQLQVRLDIEPFAVAPLLARAAPTMGWQGDLRLAAHVDIRAAERLDADVTVERRDGDLQVASGDALQLLGLTELKLALTAHDGLWVFTPLVRGRSVGEITGQVQVQTTPEQRWPPADAPIAGTVQALAADIGVWGAWVPPGWRLVGELRTSATVGGRFGQPQYGGEITGSKLGVRNLLEGVNVTDGQISVRLAGEQARIERFTLKGGDGTITVTGSAALGAKPQAQLQLTAERFRLLGRVDRTVIASGAAELLLTPDQGKLDGRFKVDEGLIDASGGNAPKLDEDVTVRKPGRPAPGDDPAANKAAPAPNRNFILALDIDLGDGKLRVKGRGVDTALTGRLRLSTPGGRLAVNGIVNTDSGTYAAYGQKLDISRGIVAFSGGLDNPALDILALRPNLDVRVGVAITGNLLTPRVRLFSDPEMGDNDKLSWLLLGRAPDGLGRNDAALLQRAAVALLSGEGDSPSDSLFKNFFLDDVSVRQSDTDARETVVSLGKQLSQRWYVGYERGVNTTAGTFQLIYRIAQRLTVRAQSGSENAIDVIWTWRFQETPPDAAMRKSTVTPR